MVKSPKRRRLSSGHLSPKSKEDDSPSVGKSKEKKEGESSPERCPICLAPPENPAKSESCSHYFCYSCLKEWSKVKAECPLCKMPIKIIYYNIKSDSEYDEYHVKNQRPESSHTHRPSMFNVASFDQWWNFRMRDLQRRNFATTHENSLAAHVAATDVDMIRTRRTYYWNKTKVWRVETGNRVRDISPEFFRENPSQMHRLEPWLKRELTVLYGAQNRMLINRVRELIVSSLVTIGITSRSFFNTLQPYMIDNTEQFIHEFLSFAKSPYDINQYDRRAHYDTRRESEVEPRSWGERSNEESSSSSWRRPSRNPLRSRWDDSPDARDNIPGESTSQSVMLSQATWGDDFSTLYTSQSTTSHSTGMNNPTAIYQSQSTAPPGVSVLQSSNVQSLFPTISSEFPTPPHVLPGNTGESGFRYAGLLGRHLPLRRSYLLPRRINREVEAPLVHQTLDVHRRSGSSARDYQRMELIRRHFDRHSRRRFEERRKTRTLNMSPNVYMVPTATSNTAEVIEVSSDSSDKEIGTTSSLPKTEGQTLLHYRPSTSQVPAAGNSGIKEEVNVVNTSSDDHISNDSDGDNSDIEFVRYIKPPHLRTPDAYIDLGSTDSDAPGPSTRHRNIKRVMSASSSSGSSESSSSDEDSRKRRYSGSYPGSFKARDILQRTRNFLKQAREASRVVNSSDDDDVTMPNSQSTMTSSSKMTPESIHNNISKTPEKTSTQVENTSNKIVASQSDDNSTIVAASSQDNATENVSSATSQPVTEGVPKKVFERGKLGSYDFTRLRRIYSSDSDDEIDVGIDVRSPTGIYSQKSSNYSRNNHEQFTKLNDFAGSTIPPACSISTSSDHDLGNREHSISNDLTKLQTQERPENINIQSHKSSRHKRKKYHKDSRKSHKKSSKYHRESKSHGRDKERHISRKLQKKNSLEKSRSSSVEFVSNIYN